MPCAGAVQFIVIRLFVAGVVNPLVRDRKMLENDIFVQLILRVFRRFLNT